MISLNPFCLHSLGSWENDYYNTTWSSNTSDQLKKTSKLTSDVGTDERSLLNRNCLYSGQGHVEIISGRRHKSTIGAMKVCIC